VLASGDVKADTSKEEGGREAEVCLEIIKEIQNDVTNCVVIIELTRYKWDGTGINKK
jgi:hypothetical protein